MSFAIPGIAIADVPNYVPKLYVESYTKDSGIVINTWYEVAILTNVDDIKSIQHMADNTGAVDKEHSVRITIDGIVATKTNTTLNDLTIKYCHIDSSGAITAPLSDLSIGDDADMGMGFHVSDSVPVTRANSKKVGGHEIKIEWRIDEAVAAGQRYRMDIVYTKKEAV